ncbi:hypothetical protein [Actinomadura sp. KC216]|uniref:hypothetical protein n=1 Tax=Actinomadura sp. KC216 TaxID=2530370 RepID=UPI0014053030|nr:hypothetical protein [Actinomadura sp. KC216]
MTLATAAPAGTTVVLTVAWSNDAPTIPTIVSVTDSRGNSYTVDTSAGTGNGTVSCAIISARVTSALKVGDTITVTIGANRQRWCLQADGFPGFLAAVLDRTGVNHTPAVSAAMSTGLTAATRSANELVVACYGFGRGGLATSTLDPGWSGTAFVTTAAGSVDRALQMGYKTVTATGTQQGTATLSLPAAYSGCIATYALTELAAAAPEVPAFLPGVPVGTVPDVFNDLIRDPLTAVLAPPVFRARRTTALAVTENLVQAIAWNVAGIDEDPYEGWDSGNPTRWVVPDGWSGWWHATATVSLSGTGASGLILIPSIAVNQSGGGNTLILEGQEPLVATGAGVKLAAGEWWVYAREDDVIELDLYYSSESTITAVDITPGQECRLELVWDGV